MKRISCILFLLFVYPCVYSQTLFDSFSDYDFAINPVWSGNTANWTLVQSSDVAAGSSFSNTLGLYEQGLTGTHYLSAPVYNWSLNQEWGIFFGRTLAPASTADQSYFWLYANETDLKSATVDGYRIAYGDNDPAGDHIRLEYIVDGAVSATIISSSGTTANGITDFGFLVRVKRSAGGLWQLFTSALPQVSGAGAIASNVPNAANTAVVQGSGTENSLVPATNGFLGIAALHAFPGYTNQQFDQVYFTASPVSPPTMTVTPAYLDSFLTVVGTSSAPKSYTVQGTNLTSDIVIAGPEFPYSNFEVSLTETPFVPAVIHLTPVAGTVPPTTLYMRMHSVYLGNVFDAIDHSTVGLPVFYGGGLGNVLANEPTIPCSLIFGAKTSTSIEVNMTGGNGQQRILFVRESLPVNLTPYDGHEYYTGGGVYGVGVTQVGTGNYAVYQGTSSNITVTGLTAGKVYYFAAYEFNKQYGELYPPDPLNLGDAGTANYLLPGSTGLETTAPPLPILVNYLLGTRQANKHVLNWKVTCISSPTATMVLERSADSRNFTGINSITASAVRCNDPFNYTDADPLKGMNYYRLKMTDADGHITYSTIVGLLNAVKGFDVVSLAPNPVLNGNFKLNIASAQAGKMEMMVYDMKGRLVNRQSLSLIAGFNSLPVDVSLLASGTYTVKASMPGEPEKLLRFVKQ